MQNNGLIYIGEIFYKKTKEYTKKDGQKGTEYNINIGHKGTSINVRVNQEIYQKIEDGKTYILPMFIRTFLYGKDKDQIGIDYSLRKGNITDYESGKVIYELS